MTVLNSFELQAQDVNRDINDPNFGLPEFYTISPRAGESTEVMVHHDMKLALEYANRVAVIKEGQKILEIGIDGEKIIAFQSGNISQQEIMELYNNESEK